MLTIPIILAIFALALAAVEEVAAQGRDIVGWAVILLAVAYLWTAVVV